MKISVAMLGLAGIAASAAAVPKGINVEGGDAADLYVRLANAETPGSRGYCPTLVRLAEHGRNFTADWLATHAERLKIQAKGIGPSGRILVTISAGGEDLGEALIAEGLARPATGDRRPWC